MLLWIIVGAEVIAAIAIAGQRMSQPSAPAVELSRMPASTIRDFRIVEATVRSDKPDDWRELGEGYLAYGYFTAAEACLRRANQQQPNDWKITMNLARCLERLWKIPEANTYYEVSAKSGDSKNAQVCYFRIGRNKLRLEQVDEAIEWLKKAPRHRPAVFELARLFHKQGRDADAATVIRQLRLSGKMESAVEMLAIKVFEALEKVPEMAESIERIERSSPGISGDGLTGDDHAEYFNPIRSRYGMLKQLAEAHAKLSQQKKEEAWAALHRCCTEAGLENIESMLTSILMESVVSGHREEALRLVEQASKVQEFYGLNLHMRASIYHLNGRPDIAEHLFILANRQMPAVPSYAALHNIYQARKDAAKLAANDREGAFRSAQQKYFESKFEEAEQALRQVPESDEDARIYFLLASIYQAKDKLPQAIEGFTACLKYDPRNGVARERLTLLKKQASKD